MNNMTKSEYENVELNYDNCVCYVVDTDVFASMLKDRASSVNISIDDTTMYNLLELDEDYDIVLGVNIPKPKYGGCYYWNRGNFPYVLNKNLKFIIFSDGYCERKTVKCAIKSKEVFGLPDLRGLVTSKLDQVTGDWFVKFTIEMFGQGEFPPENVDIDYIDLTYNL